MVFCFISMLYDKKYSDFPKKICLIKFCRWQHWPLHILVLIYSANFSFMKRKTVRVLSSEHILQADRCYPSSLFFFFNLFLWMHPREILGKENDLTQVWKAGQCQHNTGVKKKLLENLRCITYVKICSDFPGNYPQRQVGWEAWHWQCISGEKIQHKVTDKISPEFSEQVTFMLLNNISLLSSLLSKKLPCQETILETTP